MSTVRIEDVIVPEEFSEYVLSNSMERTAFYTSGVLVPNGLIAEQLHAGAQSFTVPAWLDLDSAEADISSDDPAVMSTPRKIGSSKTVVRKAFLNASWSVANLAAELSGSDPAARIKDRVSVFWARQAQHRIIATLRGMLSANLANDGGDMVVSIAAATNGGVSAATKFGAAAVIDAAQTLGDALSSLTAVAVHSITYSAMLKADLIEFIPSSQGKPIATFRGLAVTVDDGLPFTPAEGTGKDDDAPQFVSVLFGSGVLAGSFASPRSAPGTEIVSVAAAGNGAGVTTLHSRVNLAIAPVGHSWIEGNVEAASPNLAELATASHWTRVAERKAIPLAFLRHN